MSKTNKKQTIRNIILFVVMVNGLAWLGPVLGGSPTEPGLGFLIWGMAPFVAALVMKLIVRDKVDMGWRPRLKGNGRWYTLSIFIYPVTIMTVLFLGLLLGVNAINTFTMPEFITAMIPLAITFFIFALFEEVGWRGYLAPKVYSLNDRLLGHALVGIIWASWHFPYMRDLLAHTSEGLATSLPRFILGTIVLAIVYGEIRLRTGSVWPAIIMHWVGNTLANTLLAGFAEEGFVTLVPGRAWIASFGAEGVLMIAIFALLGGVLMRRRLGHSKTQPVVSAGQVT